MLLLEMALIALAVVLGFAVTNWDTDRRDRDRARTAVERIRTELRQNADGLASVAPYYAEMSERLDSILAASGDGPVGAVSIPGWRGLRPPAVRRASFEAALETGALEHVDFALVDQIAISHEALKGFSTAIDNSLAAFVSGNLTQVSEWQRVFTLLAELADIAGGRTNEVLQLLPTD